MLANMVKQNTTTTGVGDLLLGTALPSYVPVASVYANGERVYYSILEGDNREVGVGTYVSAGNKITRDFVFETLVAGVHTLPASGNLSLNGTAVVAVTGSIQGSITHAPVWVADSVALGSQSWTAAPPVGAVIGGISSPYFLPDIAADEINFSHRMSNRTTVGGEVRFSIAWSPSTTDTGVVRWGIEYSIAPYTGGSFTTTSIAYLEQAATGTIGSHQVILAAVPDQFVTSGPGEVVIGRVFRDGVHSADTFTGNAFIHGLDLNHQVDHLGTPDIGPNFYTWS